MAQGTGHQPQHQKLSLAWMREKAAAKELLNRAEAKELLERKEKEKSNRKSRKKSLKFTLNYSLSGTEGQPLPRNSKRKLEEQEQGDSEVHQARKLTRNSEKVSVSERVPKTYKNSKITYLYNTSSADQSAVGGDPDSNDGGGDGLVQLSPGLMSTVSENSSIITAVPADRARNFSPSTRLRDAQLLEYQFSTGQ